MWLASTLAATSDTIRIASYNVELARKGPGLLLRDIHRDKDADIRAALDVLGRISPDIVLLQGIDYDADLLAARAFNAALGTHQYPYLFARPPNAGVPTGLDLNGDGQAHGPADAQGFGRFFGQGGMVLLSRLPILNDQARDFSQFLWRDLPDHLIPHGTDFSGFAQDALAEQRLATLAHWDVPVQITPDIQLSLWCFQAGPPVFDGPEDRNGRRNHDEIAFWLRYLDGDLPVSRAAGPFALLGGANLDPRDGDGRHDILVQLLSHPALQDPQPADDLGATRARAEGGVNRTHQTDPRQDTANWKDQNGPGNLRVDYVLPSSDLTVVASGLAWPETGRHALVWVDLAPPPPSQP